MDIFLQATKQALRFSSVRGNLTTEQLWELPLSHKSGFDLDNVAKTANAELKTHDEDSFVASPSARNPARKAAALRLEVVKAVIADKMADAAALAAAAANKDKRQILLGALEAKEKQELATLSADEIRAQLNALA